MAETVDVVLKILEILDKSMDDEMFDDHLISHEALGITEARWSRIIAMMIEEGLIDGFIESTSMGSTHVEYIPSLPRITFRGLNYLSENSNMAKLYRAAKEIRDWIK